MALSVYVKENAARHQVWSEKGNKGDKWNFAEVTVYNTGNMQVGEITGFGCCNDSAFHEELMSVKQTNSGNFPLH